MSGPFWSAGSLPEEGVRAALAAARARDTPFASGRILGSMCTTPHPLAVSAYVQFLETNLGDPALSPGAKTLEDEAVSLLLDLLHAPAGAGGVFVSGGSEANFTGLRVALKRTNRREVIVPASAHFSFDKAIDYMGLHAQVARLDAQWRVDVEHVKELVDRNTACVVAVAGTTEHGVVDPIPALAEICADAGVPLHVDACYGGFVIPFLRRAGASLPDFDFALDGVTTVTVDPHKMGLAPIGAGVCLTRSAADLAAIGTRSPYVSVDRQPTLQGTRSGAAAAATWAVMRHLGPEGYARIADRCMTNARRLARDLRGMGADLVREPELPILVLRAKDPSLVRRLLQERGFLVSLAPLSKGIKIVCMPHVTEEALNRFLPVLGDVLAKTGDL